MLGNESIGINAEPRTDEARELTARELDGVSAGVTAKWNVGSDYWAVTASAAGYKVTHTHYGN